MSSAAGGCPRSTARFSPRGRRRESSGPPYIGHVKDVYPDRAVMYCFLIGILLLGAGYLFSYLLNDDAVRLGRPTVAGTLREYGIPLPEAR